MNKSDKKLYQAEEKRHDITIERENKRHEKAHLIEEKRAEKRGYELALSRLQARHGFHMIDPRRKHELEDMYGNE